MDDQTDKKEKCTLTILTRMNSKKWTENNSCRIASTQIMYIALQSVKRNWVDREWQKYNASCLRIILLTLQAISIEQVLAFFMALNTAFGATKSLSRQTPQEAFALVAVSW